MKDKETTLFKGFAIYRFSCGERYSIITEFHGKIICQSLYFNSKYPSLKNNFFTLYENNKYLVEPFLFLSRLNTEYYFINHFINLLFFYCIYPQVCTKKILYYIYYFEKNKNFSPEKFLSSLIYCVFYSYDNQLKKKKITHTYLINLIKQHSHFFLKKSEKIIDLMFFYDLKNNIYYHKDMKNKFDNK